MTLSTYSFEPLDTLWFRDGRPFDQTDDGLADARTIFPPSPQTLAGAVAAIMARKAAVGWDPVGEIWDDSGHLPGGDVLNRLAALTGRENDVPDQIWTMGPFLADEASLLCPFPATLTIKKGAGDLLSANQLTPRIPVGENSGLSLPLCASLPPPTDRPEEFGDAENSWIRLEQFVAHMNDMSSFIAREPGGKPPLERICTDDVIKREARIGIGLDPGSRTAVQSQLYASQHLRLTASTRWRLTVCVRESSPGTPDIDGETGVLGGKGRIARVVRRNLDLYKTLLDTSPPMELRHSDGRVYFRLTALTPIPTAPDKPFGFSLGFGEDEPFWSQVRVENAIISAKPEAYGVWASKGGVRTSVVRAFAPGSTWFLSAPAGGLTEGSEGTLRRSALYRRFCGRVLGAQGFGFALAGEWPEWKDFRTRIGR